MRDGTFSQTDSFYFSNTETNITGSLIPFTWQLIKSKDERQHFLPPKLTLFIFLTPEVTWQASQFLSFPNYWTLMVRASTCSHKLTNFSSSQYNTKALLSSFRYTTNKRLKVRDSISSLTRKLNKPRYTAEVKCTIAKHCHARNLKSGRARIGRRVSPV